MSKHKKINSDTVHRWANQIGDYSETKGGRLFFRGDTIYSHGEHFPIARYVKLPDASGGLDNPGFRYCILFTTRTYSVTTARHISEVSQAIPGDVTVFHVDNVRAGENAEHPEDTAKQHQHNQHNLDDYQTRIVGLSCKAKRARCNKDLLLVNLHRTIAEHNNYIDFFGLSAKKITQDGKLVKNLVQEAEEARKRELEREKERERQTEIRSQVEIKEWESGESNRFPYWVKRVYLRKASYSRDLETSKGAIVPLEHARKAFKVVQKCRERQKGFSPNGKSLPIGHYVIEAIDAQGNVRAGCHLIDWPIIEGFARKEGWLDAEESATLEGDHSGEHDVVQDAINEAALHQ